MNNINEISITKQDMLCENCISHEVLQKLKSSLSGAIDEMRSLTEKYYVNTAQGRDIIETYKQSIFLVNLLIKKHNQHNAKKRAITLLNVNFNLWRTHEGNSITGKLPQAIIDFFDNIVANLGYRDAYNTALTSKAAYRLIRNDACNAFRMRFFCFLENYVKNRQQAFFSRDGYFSGEVIKGSKVSKDSERYTMEYDQHLIFEEAVKYINNYLQKAKLSEKNIISISQDWLSLRETFSTSQNW